VRPVKVRAYSGYKADQEPRSFALEGKEIGVEVLASYLRQDAEDGRLYAVYRVRGDDGRVYELWLDLGEEEWYLIPLPRPGIPTEA